MAEPVIAPAVCRVVDTNVLLVASAADAASPFGAESTPIEEAALREKVLEWVHGFESDPSRHVVLDYGWDICAEYQNKLGEQDYGWLALMAKRDRNEVVWVGLEHDADGHALLEPTMAEAVTDLADRKIVAAGLAAIAAGHPCQITNACDTDWLDCNVPMEAAGLDVEHLLEDWMRARWLVKHGTGRK